ncbi:MAG: hypothetical protein JWR70_3235, partial [Modestobacter sp.]|nr:hypothetical protein [Modestobacter sp.]
GSHAGRRLRRLRVRRRRVRLARLIRRRHLHRRAQSFRNRYLPVIERT